MDSEDHREFLTTWPPPSPEEVSQDETKLSNSPIPEVLEPVWEEHNTHVTQELGCHFHKRKRQKMHQSEDASTADVLLARWWRKNKILLTRDVVPQNVSAHTLLSHIARLPEARILMQKEIAKLETCLDISPTSQIYVSLGTLHERLGNFTKAFAFLQKASSIDPQNREALWLLERVLRQLKVSAAQVTATSRLNDTPTCLRPPLQVERRSANSLPYEEFLLQYAITKTPVVITGLQNVITSTPWTLDHIKHVAGKCKVTTQKPIKGSAEWGRLEPGPELTVTNVIERINNPSSSQDPVYLFDWSLPLYCPQLATELTIPKYFAGDYLQRTPDGQLYRDSWPSLFVAPSGITSELHVDAFGSNFWMALLSGTKRWVFYSPEDAPLLYPSYSHSLDPVFEVDLSDPDLDLHPLVILANPREVTLQEGEVLFVPAGSPHRVENLTDSVAVSANFVDLSNLNAVKQELTAQGLVDPRAKDLLEALNSSSMDISVNMQQHHLPFAKFKEQNKNR